MYNYPRGGRRPGCVQQLDSKPSIEHSPLVKQSVMSQQLHKPQRHGSMEQSFFPHNDFSEPAVASSGGFPQRSVAPGREQIMSSWEKIESWPGAGKFSMPSNSIPSSTAPSVNQQALNVHVSKGDSSDIQFGFDGPERALGQQSFAGGVGQLSYHSGRYDEGFTSNNLHNLSVAGTFAQNWNGLSNPIDPPGFQNPNGGGVYAYANMQMPMAQNVWMASQNNAVDYSTANHNWVMSLSGLNEASLASPVQQVPMPEVSYVTSSAPQGFELMSHSTPLAIERSHLSFSGQQTGDVETYIDPFLDWDVGGDMDAAFASYSPALDSLPSLSSSHSSPISEWDDGSGRAASSRPYSLDHSSSQVMKSPSPLARKTAAPIGSKKKSRRTNTSNGTDGLGQRERESQERLRQDKLLVEWKKAGMSYKEIREKGGFKEAESTLRGRFRSLTRTKNERVRKPVWTEKDVELLIELVLGQAGGKPIDVHKISWKNVAQEIAERGGTYHFGNATTKKKWMEIARHQHW